MDNFLTKPEHEEFVKRMEDQHARSDKRLSLIENKLSDLTDLTIEVKSLAQSVESMAESINKQNERIVEIEGKDGEKWNAAVMCAITAIISAIVGYVAKALGLG